eukprot:GHVH01005225.1.p2 GENE.GHVH01005225.1~~GHVH01005225.1.p2  ORF type:complete len:532 (-),score=96.52 GHVH01005225.1:20-1615(-)
MNVTDHSEPLVLGGSRRAGVLCHVTSLPGLYGCGDLGDISRTFIDWLQSIGASVWQILPVSFTSASVQYSPYSPSSSVAVALQLLDIQGVIAMGLLPSDFDISHFMVEHGYNFYPESNRADLAQAEKFRRHFLKFAFQTMMTDPSGSFSESFSLWRAAESDWLDDFCLYQVIKTEQDGLQWSDWTSEALKWRDEASLIEIAECYDEDIRFEAFVQFLLSIQIESLLQYARSKGVVLMGDVPIYMSNDSADIWQQAKLHLIDQTTGKATFVAGVPPDYFSETGQRWGMPLPNWEKQKATNYAWWRMRLKKNFKMVDALRIDHFRGFASYWKIPADEPTAVVGTWCDGPGQSLVDALLEIVDVKQIVAEDLGGETFPDVIHLRDTNRFRGMAVLQFGFDGSPDHLPHNYTANRVVYPGTHDNETMSGWWNSCNEKTRDKFIRYTNLKFGESPVDAAIQLAMASVAETAIISMMDILSLGNDSRINDPANQSGNWLWKMTIKHDGLPQFTDRGKRFKEMVAIYDREQFINNPNG